MPANAAVLAARNNADLHAAIFRAHGRNYTRDEAAFIALDEPPPLFAGFISLDPAPDSADVNRIIGMQVANIGPTAIKDSFCTLDPARSGMRQLFGSQWIFRPACHHSMPESWAIIDCETELGRWNDAWKHAEKTEANAFAANCLAHPDLVFLGKYAEGRLTGGCLANISDRVVGLSNLFGEGGSAPVLSEAADAVSAIGKDRAVVGYENGSVLAEAVACGFTQVGPLRVLVAR